MTMERNPRYWDKERPYLDTIKFAIIPETNSRIATVVQGGATMMAGYPYQFGSNATAEGVATKEIPIRGINRAYLNQVKGPLTDVRAREALYSAIDRSRLMQAFTQMTGYKAPTNYFGDEVSLFRQDLCLAGLQSKESPGTVQRSQGGWKALQHQARHLHQLRPEAACRLCAAGPDRLRERDGDDR